MTKFLLHQTDQNGLSHVIRPQEVYLLVPTLWLNSVKLKGISSRFYKKKHTKTNDTLTSLSFTQHNSYFVKNKIIILFFLFFLLILLAIDKCNHASSLAISVSQHCERAFRTPFICLCAPYTGCFTNNVTNLKRNISGNIACISTKISLYNRKIIPNNILNS